MIGPATAPAIQALLPPFFFFGAGESAAGESVLDAEVPALVVLAELL